MLLKVALNGARDPSDHPAIPVTPAQLAADAAASVAAGAAAIHLHVRGPDGGESLRPGDLATALAAVRGACPSVPLGISTGLWIVSSPAERLDMARGWTELPDFASVNFSEDGAVELSRLLIERDVGVEAGLSTPDDAARLALSGLAPECLRVLIEPDEADVAAALATATAIAEALDRDGIWLPRLLHGSEATAWPLLREAVVRGYDARIGFEDTLQLPDGALAADNAALVAAARRMLR